MALRKVGLQKTSLLDFPGEVAATVFTPGCNLRCPYCHNPQLVVPPHPDDMISLEELDDFLHRRAGVLGGVCLTGGEPLLHEELPELIDMIRSHGLKVKLDTNGTFPQRLAQLKVDYVAMDLKTDPAKYGRLLGERSSGEGDLLERRIARQIIESAVYLRENDTPYELRTTVAPGIVTPEDMRAMLPLLNGAERYLLTPCRGGNTLDPAFSRIPPPGGELLEELYRIASKSGVPCEIGPYGKSRDHL